MVFFLGWKGSRGVGWVAESVVAFFPQEVISNLQIYLPYLPATVLQMARHGEEEEEGELDQESPVLNQMGVLVIKYVPPREQTVCFCLQSIPE